jgi:hypothetical protein
MRDSYQVRTIDPLDWDALVARLPDGTVFHSLAWLETLAATYGQVMTLSAAFAADRCVGAWPYLQWSKGPLRVIGSPLPASGTVYMGPLFAGEADVADVLDSFLSHRLFRRYLYFSCRAIDRSRPVDLGAFGFSRVRSFDTYWLDLTIGEGALWRNLKSECRNRIRKAERLGIEVRHERNADFVEDFWAMSIETFARTGTRPTHNRVFAESLWQRLAPSGRLIALSAFHENRRIATLVLPCDGRVAYYWGGAALAETRHLPAANLLHWEAIREALRRGLAGYDFISTTGGPGRFKTTFGPVTRHAATHWERMPSALIALLKRGVERYQRRRPGVAA